MPINPTPIPFPLLSAPGRHPQASGGRLVNVMVEKLAKTAGSEFVYWRVPGLKAFGTTTRTNFRGAILVATTVFVVMGDRVFSFTSAGGAGTMLSGTVPGSAPVTMARNNATSPDVAFVSPGDGAFVIAGGAVASYPDPNVGQPNSVTFHKGVFVFTYGDGKVRNSNINSTTINTLNVATAESKPDLLWRSIPLGNGQLLLCGDGSMEAWGGQNDTGFIFSYIATIPRGLAGQYAVTGHEDGFGRGIFYVGDDNKVGMLDGYTPTAISTPDIDVLIEALADKSTLRMSCYTASGHAFVVIQSPTWCWEYDVDLGTWHERQSHLKTYWRGRPAIKAFGKWLAGDTETGNLIQIDGTAQDELGNPLRMRIETGPFGAFPKKMRIGTIELAVTRGVGIAIGNDPVQTDPDVEFCISRNGGQDWTPPRVRKVGRQSIMTGRIRANNFGHADQQGLRCRFDFSSNVGFGIMGAMLSAVPLQ